MKVFSEGKIIDYILRPFNCRTCIINKVKKVDAKPLIPLPILNKSPHFLFNHHFKQIFPSSITRMFRGSRYVHPLMPGSNKKVTHT